MEVNIRAIQSIPLEKCSPLCVRSFENHAREILDIPESSYLVTGFRGVGKTTYVNFLIDKVQQLSQKPVIVLKVNLALESTHEAILKRLVRQLYHNAENIDLPDDWRQSIGDLFARTYSEITDETIHQSASESLQFVKTSIALKDVAVSIFACLLTSNISLGLNLNPGLVTLLSVVASLITLWLSSTVFSSERHASSKTQHESRAKQLFDEEILEYRLLKVFEDLKCQYRTIVILDEGDKLQQSPTIMDLLSGLRPILLGGCVTSIVVSGKSTYNEWVASTLEEDGSHAAFFSNHIHVPLLSEEETLRIAKQVLGEGASHVLPKLYYKSKGVPRLLFMEIRRMLQCDTEGRWSLATPNPVEMGLYKDLISAITATSSRFQDSFFRDEGSVDTITDFCFRSVGQIIRRHTVSKSELSGRAGGYLWAKEHLDLVVDGLLDELRQRNVVEVEDKSQLIVMTEKYTPVSREVSLATSIPLEPLLGLFEGKDRLEMEEAVGKYQPLLRKLAKHYRFLGIDQDELLGEAAVSLLEALATYENDSDESLDGYIARFVYRDLELYVSQEIRERENAPVSLEQDAFDSYSDFEQNRDFDADLNSALELQMYMGRLPFLERRVLELTYGLNGNPRLEDRLITVELGLGSVNRVRSLRMRGLARMRNYLREEAAPSSDLNRK